LWFYTFQEDKIKVGKYLQIVDDSISMIELILSLSQIKAKKNSSQLNRNGLQPDFLEQKWSRNGMGLVALKSQISKSRLLRNERNQIALKYYGDLNWE